MNIAGTSSRTIASAVPVTLRSGRLPRRCNAALGGLVRHRSTAATAAVEETKDEGGSQSAPLLDPRVASYEERLRADAYFRMLGTPLRRCVVTSAMLPKAVMFQLAPHVPKELRHKIPDSLAEDFANVQAEVRSRLTRPRRARWIRRETKVNVRKTLMRRMRMMQHKVDTSTTDASRERFKGMLASVKRQLSTMHAPILTDRNARWLPHGLLRTSKRAAPLPSTQATDDTTPTMVRDGIGNWCILRNDVAEAMRAKGGPKSREWPGDTLARVSEQLEWRVLQEAQWLFVQVSGRLKRLRSSKAAEEMAQWKQIPWILRRLRGDEVRAYVASRGNTITLRDKDVVRPAAVLQLHAADIQGVAGERKEEAEATPTYSVENLVLRAETRAELLDVLREISTVVRKTAELLSKKFGAPKRQGVAADKGRKVTKPQTPSTSPGDADTQLWPRLTVIRQDPLTVDLCIALFRLNMWRMSEKHESEKVADDATDKNVSATHNSTEDGTATAAEAQTHPST